MHIFIDESGNFLHPTKKKHLISCVSALVVPDQEIGRVYEQLLYFKRKWKIEGEELKGSQMNEVQAFDLIKRMTPFNLFLYAECIDMGFHTSEGIDLHKGAQAKAFNAAKSGTEHSSMQNELEALANKIGASSNQLYVQSTLLIKLCSEVIRKSTLYYSQFAPAELGNIKWHLDVKGKSFEELWKVIVLPGLQDTFLKEPLLGCPEFDYSHFDKTYKSSVASVPSYLKEHLPDGASSETTDLKKLLSQLSFDDSKVIKGLQIVDLLSSVITRACNDTLQQNGWNEIGKLFLGSEKGSHPLGMIALQDFDIDKGETPYNNFFKQLYKNVRPIILQ